MVAEPGDEDDGEPAEDRGQPTIACRDSDGEDQYEASGEERIGGEKGEPVGTADETNATGDAGHHPPGKAELCADEKKSESRQKESSVGVQ